MHDVGSIVLMQNELFVRMCKWFSVFFCLIVTVMAASSALFIVFLSCCYFMLMCVMVFVQGSTIPDPRMGFPLTCDPSV